MPALSHVPKMTNMTNILPWRSRLCKSSSFLLCSLSSLCLLRPHPRALVETRPGTSTPAAPTGTSTQPPPHVSGSSCLACPKHSPDQPLSKPAPGMVSPSRQGASPSVPLLPALQSAVKSYRFPLICSIHPSSPAPRRN